MRTFPKALAEFRRMVEARGAELRSLSHQDLLEAGNRPVEHLVVQGRRARISIIVQSRADGALRVVVQGFMPGRLFFFVMNVALDGFYKLPDGSVEPMPDRELYEFD